ncbi:MAG: hypothetical protein JWM02_971 [Frankiales bacterium]|nr:hypothetical protein [Frankiales bacterium]
MGHKGSTTSLVTDPCIVLGRLAGVLADGTALQEALDVLVSGLGLRTAVVRAVSGELLAVGGEVLQAVPLMRALPNNDPTLELPVPGRSGAQIASLTVGGARPSQLPALRTAAAVIGLALAPTAGVDELLDAAEDDLDELADALHDGPVQSLVVARYAADAAVRGGDPVAARDAVQEVLVEVRRALWHLRPRGAAGLIEALRQLSEQLVEAGGHPLGLVGDLDAAARLRGTRATVAYRLIQAVARPHDDAVRVALRCEDGVLVADVHHGAVLPSPEHWARRVHALGGDLSASAGRLRLVLPLTDARTTP